VVKVRRRKGERLEEKREGDQAGGAGVNWVGGEVVIRTKIRGKRVSCLGGNARLQDLKSVMRRRKMVRTKLDDREPMGLVLPPRTHHPVFKERRGLGETLLKGGRAMGGDRAQEFTSTAEECDDGWLNYVFVGKGGF